MHPFDRDMQLEAGPDGIYGARISDAWCIHQTPNGGYLMALITEAMMQAGSKRSSPIVTANFISRCTPDDGARIRVESFAASAQFERLQAVITQEGSEKARAMGTFAVETDTCFIERFESSAPEIPPAADCIAIPALPGYSLYDHVEVRLDPVDAGWLTGGELSNRSVQRGWFRFRDERPFDTGSLLLAADAFPPPIMATQGMVAWVPTIEMSVNIRRIPDTRWLKCIFRTRFVNCGMLEEDGQIWDEKDQLVAVSRQIAQYRKPAVS